MVVHLVTNRVVPGTTHIVVPVQGRTPCMVRMRFQKRATVSSDVGKVTCKRCLQHMEYVAAKEEEADDRCDYCKEHGIENCRHEGM
jgi:hypothetical protein